MASMKSEHDAFWQSSSDIPGLLILGVFMILMILMVPRDAPGSGPKKTFTMASPDPKYDLLISRMIRGPNLPLVPGMVRNPSDPVRS